MHTQIDNFNQIIAAAAYCQAALIMLMRIAVSGEIFLRKRAREKLAELGIKVG